MRSIRADADLAAAKTRLPRIHARDHLVRFGDGIGIPQKRATTVCGRRVVTAHTVLSEDPGPWREQITCPGCRAILAERDREAGKPQTADDMERLANCQRQNRGEQ